MLKLFDLLGNLAHIINSIRLITTQNFRKVAVLLLEIIIIISSYKHLTLTGISYNASRLLNENIKKNKKITLNYQQLSNEFGDNNLLVPKKGCKMDRICGSSYMET